MKKNGRILAVVGAQYGSEGKGVIVNRLANQFDIHVRVGGPNAGHSFVHEGKVYKMQVIPCGWTNPNAKVMIGRGALINIKMFRKELEEIKQVYPDIEQRIFIDYRAGILDEKFASMEGHTQGELHKRIGSTGEGVGAARIARIERNAMEFRLAKDTEYSEGIAHMLADTVKMLNEANIAGKSILLEGAQGSALSLIHGPWPYVTSHDTNAAQMAADIGLAPQLITDVMLVARTYPIRVAGNSGPLENELLWEELSERLGKKVEEKTTVTKKIRRIGGWDDNLIDRAVLLNRPTHFVITFIDYINPEDAGKEWIDELSPDSLEFIRRVEKQWGVKVSFVGTGGYEIDGQFHVAVPYEPTY